MKPETIAKANAILTRIADIKDGIERWRNRTDVHTIEAAATAPMTGGPETSRVVWQRYRHDSVQALEAEQIRLEQELAAL